MKIEVNIKDLSTLMAASVVASGSHLELTIVGAKSIAEIFGAVAATGTKKTAPKVEEEPEANETPQPKVEEPDANEEPEAEKPKPAPRKKRAPRKKKTESLIPATEVTSLTGTDLEPILEFFDGTQAHLSPFCNTMGKLLKEAEYPKEDAVELIRGVLRKYHPTKQGITTNIPDDKVPAIMIEITSLVKDIVLAEEDDAPTSAAEAMDDDETF